MKVLQALKYEGGQTPPRQKPKKPKKLTKPADEDIPVSEDGKRTLRGTR